MVLQAFSSSEIESWKKIQHTASSITNLLNATSLQAKPNCHPTPRILELDLPFPHEVLQPLLALDIPEKMLQDILQCFSRRVKELQDQFRSMCRRLQHECALFSTLNNTEDTMRRMCLNLYKRRCIPVLQSIVSKVLTDVSNRQQPKKAPFNSQFTPFLEACFEHNAYPSAGDRQVLAQKSGMTCRQIEVWFQNHRNRAKKEGKNFQRSTNGSTLELAIQASTSDLSFARRSPSEPESSEYDSEGDVYEPSISSTPLLCVPSRPLHAFPTSYPPTSCDDPFPRSDGIFRFLTPDWYRRPATKMARQASIDVDSLAGLFASKLHLRDGTTKHREKASPSSWTAATVTVPCQAPHPALIRNAYSCPTSYRSSETRFGCVSHLGLPLLPAAGHHPTSFSTRPKLRKKSCLTERRPSSVNDVPQLKFDHPNISEPVSSRFSSRQSLLSESRSSSMTSLASIEPSTPPDSPQLDSIQPKLPFSDFDLHSLEELFPSSIFGNSLNPDLTSPPLNSSLWTLYVATPEPYHLLMVS